MNVTRYALGAALGVLISGAALGAVIAGGALAGQGPMHHSPEERFKAMDKDGDGKISEAEFEAHHSAKLMASDLNGDGKVTFDEMKDAREKRREERAQAFFKTLDTDGDGAVTEAELKARPNTRFTTLDADKDGSLSMDELKTARHKWHGSRCGYGPDMD